MHTTFKLFGLLAVMAIGVLMGVQLAERGIRQVTGPPQPATYIKKLDHGRVELGTVRQSENLSVAAGPNYVSRVGTTMGAWVKSAARSAVQWLGSAFWP